LSWISSNKRTFSIAIAAWSENVVTNSICLSVKGRTSERVKIGMPIGTLAQHWDAEDRAVISQFLCFDQGVFWISLYICDMDHSTFD
jgi:hypothetical protein